MSLRSAVIRSFSIRMLTGFTTTLAESGQTSSSTFSPLDFSVDPVSTMSTITSERPTIGASSMEPFSLMISTVWFFVSLK